MTEPFDSLNPPEIAVTMRSLPRRVREALGQLETLDKSLGEVGPNGESPLDIVDDMGRSLAVIDRGLEQALLHDEATLTPGVMDPAARTWQVPAGDRSTVLEALDDISGELADRIDGADGAAWLKSVAVAGGREVTALDVAREAARTGVTRLRDLEAFVPAD